MFSNTKTCPFIRFLLIGRGLKILNLLASWKLYDAGLSPYWKHIELVRIILLFFLFCPVVISDMLKQGLDSFDVENIIMGFLLARQSCLEGPHVFPTYAEWFKVSFAIVTCERQSLYAKCFTLLELDGLLIFSNVIPWMKLKLGLTH